MSNITTNIKAIRDIMRKDTGVDGDAQRISQMVWMLFMKIFADKEEEWDLTIDDYDSPIPENLKWQIWASNDEGLTGDSLMEFVNSELFPALKNLDITFSPQAKIIRSVFEDTYNYMKNGTLFRQVINEIDKIDFNSTSERHVFNDIYETILKELQSAGDAGEYYTPRAVTQFMVDILNPKLGESVLDPACGTGGFLTCGVEHVRKQVNTSDDREKLQSTIRGIEKKPLPHLLCTTNLMLHGFDLPAVRRDNLLSKPYADWGKSDRVDIILTNPPFGGVEEDGTETNFPSKFRTKETADLFLALIVKLLKDGGRCAVVLPDGSLFGEGVKTRIKEELLNKCNLHTIVRLPKHVFAPYADLRTNVLFFDKGKPTKEVWYFEHPYPKGQKSYSKTRPIKIEEFDLEKNWWSNRVTNQYAWKVSIDEIVANNFNLDIRNPHILEGDLKSSTELKAKLEGTNDEIKGLLAQFKQIIKNGLSHKILLESFDDLLAEAKNVTELRRLIVMLALKGEFTKDWRNSNENSGVEELDSLKIKFQSSLKLSKRDIEEMAVIKEGLLDDSIPESWAWSLLHEVSEFWNGKAHEGCVDEKGGYILVNSKFVSTNGEKLKKVNNAFSLLYPNDIAIVMSDVPNGRALSRCFLVEKEGLYSLNQRIGGITPFDGIYPPFLKLVLDRNNHYLKINDGVKQTNMKRIHMITCPVPFPSKAEQIQIVERSSSMIDLCDRLSDLINIKDKVLIQLMQSCLKEVFA